MAYPTTSTTVAEAAAELREVLNRAPAVLLRISDREAALPYRPGGWSRKQILGHLIDSAANNHHRFVRAQQEEVLSMPAYAQEEWVAAQHYQSRPFRDLVALWTEYNRHMLHLLTTVPPAVYARPCEIGGAPPVTLQFVMIDYVAHLKHHLGQITPQ